MTTETKLIRACGGGGAVESGPCLKRLAAGFPPRRLGFDPRSGFVEDKVVFGQIFSE
jgi:hypothetical protein